MYMGIFLGVCAWFIVSAVVSVRIGRALADRTRE